MSNNLDFTLTGANQNQIHVTINDGFNDVDACLTENLSVPITDDDEYTLTETQYCRNYRFLIDPDSPAPTGTIDFRVPALKRGLFLVQNNTLQNVEVNVVGGVITPVTVEPAEFVLCYGDETRIIAMSATTVSPGSSIVLKLDNDLKGTASSIDFQTQPGAILDVTDLTGGNFGVKIGGDIGLHQGGNYLLVAPTGADGEHYTFDLTPPLLTYTVGMIIKFVPDVTNEANADLALNGLTAIPLLQSDGIAPIAAGTLSINTLYLFWYDGSGFRIIQTTAGGGTSIIVDANGSGAMSANTISLRDGLGTVAEIDEPLSAVAALKVSLDMEDVRSNRFQRITTTSSSSTAYTGTLDPSLTAYPTEGFFYFLPNLTNTGPVTVNLDGQGAKDLVHWDGITPLSAGQLLNGHLYEIWYDGTNFRVQIATSGGGGGDIPLMRATILSPQNGDNRCFGFFEDGVTIQSIRAVLHGGTAPSVDYTVEFSNDRSVAGTEVITGGVTVTNTTTGDVQTSFDDPVIPDGHWLVVKLSNITGDPDEINFTIKVAS